MSPAEPGVPTDGALIDVALRKLGSLSALNAADRALVARLAGPAVRRRSGEDLGDDGDGSCQMLVSGWACRTRRTPWGERQILDFLTPCDTVGLSLQPQPEALYRVVMLGPGVTLDLSALRDRLRAGTPTHPALGEACQRETHAKAARLIDHAGRLGAATAAQAMGHLLLDLRHRLVQVGLVEDARFPFPLSQDVLHQALGVTVTQVYRVLTRLRREGLIALGPGWAEIPDPAALAAAAGLETPAQA